ncbi:MAG: nucleotide exchange factor GrpE [Phycisphaerales bacterium]|nr:nucleotide exchange factor GrpE [Phycisphaerales bacterium]
MSERELHEDELDQAPDDGDTVDETQALIEQLTAERDEATAKYQRALADFQNFQRRAYANEEQARLRARADLIRELVPALENLDLVSEQDLGPGSEKSVQQGVRMVRDEILKVLSAHGAARIEVQPGDEFDPNRHEAMMRIDAPGIEANHIAQQMQVGYAVGNIVVRPAKVALARGEQ